MASTKVKRSSNGLSSKNGAVVRTSDTLDTFTSASYKLVTDTPFSVGMYQQMGVHPRADPTQPPTMTPVVTIRPESIWASLAKYRNIVRKSALSFSWSQFPSSNLNHSTKRDLHYPPVRHYLPIPASTKGTSPTRSRRRGPLRRSHPRNPCQGSSECLCSSLLALPTRGSPWWETAIPRQDRINCDESHGDS